LIESREEGRSGKKERVGKKGDMGRREICGERESIQRVQKKKINLEVFPEGLQLRMKENMYICLQQYAIIFPNIQ